MDNRFSGNLYTRFIHKYFLRDLWFDLQLEAKREAVAYIKAHMRAAAPQCDRLSLLDFATELAKAEALNSIVAEFGVSKGKTVRHLARLWPRVHGFDSFEGLPDRWTGTFEGKGAFSLGGKPPRVPANVTLHKGWFDETIPAFLATHEGPAALLHLDADIYASTKTVLDLFTPRIKPGTILVFDEYFAYWGWREHEFKALADWKAETGATTSYRGFSTTGGQVAVRVDTI
jgi:hypothetical protein